MSNYVCIDENRRKSIYAEKCNTSHLGVKYFCPTPGCSAKLTLRSLNGKNRPYFAALKSHPHDPNICTINNLSNKLKLEKYNLSDFSFESFYNSIVKFSDVNKTNNINSSTTKNNLNSSNNRLNTTTKLYYYCKSFDIYHKLNENLMVKNLIADNRTNFIFTKDICGLRLVESKFYLYDNTKNELLLKYPLDENCLNKYILKLHFANEEIFKTVLKKSFECETDHSKVIFGVLAKFNKLNNTKVLTCSIESSKQIVIIK